MIELVRRRVRAHPLVSGVAAAVAVAGIVVVLVWFQPQALLFDSVVDEEFPAPAQAAGEDGDDGRATPTPTDAAAAAGGDDESGETASDADTEDAAVGGEDDGMVGAADGEDDGMVGAAADVPADDAPRTLVSGTFESRNRYTVEGTATVYELDGARVLRLEDFESTNGPDLLVYLTAADHADADGELDEDFVNLGDLRGNIGNQNYDIPDDVDLERYDTAVIWCRRFSVSFGAADLAPAPG